MTDASTPTVRYWRCERFPFSIVWAAGYHADLAAELDTDPGWEEVVVMTPAELAAIKAEVAESIAHRIEREGVNLNAIQPEAREHCRGYNEAIDDATRIARTPDQIGDTP